MRRLLYLLFACAPILASAGAAESRRIAVNEPVKVRTRWVRLESLPVPRLTDGWHLYSDADAKTLLDGLTMAKLAEVEEGPGLRVTGGEPAALSFVPSKRSQNEPSTSVTITVGGVPQEFSAREVGVDVELALTAWNEDGVKLLTTVKRTRFLGFKEYGGVSVADGTAGAATKVKVPTGFWQPIFDTEIREYSVRLEFGRQAMLQCEWPRASAEETKKWELVPQPPAEAVTGGQRREAPALKVLLILALE